jgi:polyisoprenoid-binding protein YceI
MSPRRSLLALLLLLFCAGSLQAVPFRYPFDKNHTTIGFAAPIMGLSKVTGKFTDFKGAILFPDKDKKDPATATVEVTIQTASIDSGIADRDEDLRSAEFFDAAKYPEITFKSKHVRQVSGDNYAVDGTFTMRGVSKDITIPFKLLALRDVIGAEAHIKLNRRDYGVAWTRKMDDGSMFVGDEIEVDLYILTRVGAEPKEGEPAKPGEKKDPHH